MVSGHIAHRSLQGNAKPMAMQQSLGFGGLVPLKSG
jgi:hypothetical protein